MKKKFSCGQCVYSTAWRGSLRRHLLTVHGDDSKPHECNQCPAAFKIKNQLTIHIATAHENIRFQCDFCEKDYSRKELLSVHLRLKHRDQIENDMI